MTDDQPGVQCIVGNYCPAFGLVNKTANESRYSGIASTLLINMQIKCQFGTSVHSRRWNCVGVSEGGSLSQVLLESFPPPPHLSH